MNIIHHNWNWAHGLSARSATDAIVIHHAAADNASPEGVHTYHLSQGWAGIGYHLFIRKDGSVHEGRPLWASGAHVKDHNWHTIGICLEGNYDVPGAIVPQAQMDALHEALRYLRGIYPNTAIKFHRDFGGSVCPGRYFPAEKALAFEREEDKVPVDDRPWYIKNGEWDEAKKLGITDGTRPEDKLTRAEGAAMVLRAYKLAKEG